ncbi:Na+/H+ antiporter [Acetobacterium wieringae]|uniref:Sodium, potassium, lithium and rubidium/H(+) antiporter n=1 Tax=Acetobacterium wieringae TaxID=52694 RepID=A0A1F2PMC7_9FIRM|nr:Na+/H+ antiporter [Acetobacterium wieringae]OFV72004.1 sodium, potassium, lithium and rubidium/H(+) antiporter [Acetobacterium wieringae]
MNLLLIILMLLLCLLISDVISHFIPFIPTALIQIGLGLGIAFIMHSRAIELETEWFLILFVAPLLYDDGRHFSRENLWKMREPIFGNAIILVLLTTILGGYFIHWLMPYMPLAAAFALAAVLSPTDPVAVNGIAKRVNIPPKVLTLVRGESLINDASGLVAFNYAIAAVVTGYFSLRDAALNFTYMFIVGAVLGLTLGLVIDWIGFILRKKGIRDATFHSLLQILTPFIIYIVTEELFHASGVIAVVVAGIAHAAITEHTSTMLAKEKVISENVWSVLLFVLNGVVFILLGLNIPLSMGAAVASEDINNWLAIAGVLVIWLGIFGIRFVYSYSSTAVQYLIAKRQGAEVPSIKSSLLISLTGVRGAVTMVAVLSVPTLLASGEEFPQRSLILFIATGVILVTLVAATLFLPLLCKTDKAPDSTARQLDFNAAMMRIFLATIKRIRQEITPENELVADELISEYKRMVKRIQNEDNSPETQVYLKKLNEMKYKGLRAEADYLRDARENNRIDPVVYEKFEATLDRREEALSNDVRFSVRYFLAKTLRLWHQFRRHFKQEPEKLKATINTVKELQINAFEAAIASLEQEQLQPQNQADGEIIAAVILGYQGMIRRLARQRSENREADEVLKEELRIKAMDSERQEIQRMYESGEITIEQSRKLRRHINYIESATLDESEE